MAEMINMPKLGFDMAEGTLVRWLKKEGETINKGEVLAEIETDKATVEVESGISGVLRKLLVDEGAVVPVNSPIAIVGSADEKIDDIAPQPGKETIADKLPEELSEPERSATAEDTQSPMVNQSKASPLARKMASEWNVNLKQLRGSGPGGRIVKRDVEAASKSNSPTTEPGAQIITPVSTVGERSSSLPLTKLRKAISRRMADSKASIPHFYVTHEYKMDILLEVRRQLNGMLPDIEKITVNDFIVKAAALSLRQFPNLNASLQGDRLLRHGQVNIGVAVAVEGGLMTVVCREADIKPLRQVATEIKSMAARARDGKVKPEDIEGSTFSISNLGMYDVENFTAIINPPEGAILAVGSAREVAVLENGLVRAGWRMKVTISVDHRISDGVEAAKFMQALAVYLEEPVRLLV